MVLQFLFGVTKFSGYPSEVLNTLCVEKSDDDSDSDDSDGESGDDSASYSVVHKVTFNILHWLFEAQDNDTITKLLGSSDVQLHKKFREVIPFDCFVLGYCMSHSNCTWKIPLLDCNIGDEGVELLVRGAVEVETHCTGEISEINLGQNNISSKGVKQLVNFPKRLINKLRIFTLHDNNLGPDSCVALAHLIPDMPHLKKLDLSNNPNIGQGGVVPLITSLTACNSLETLWLLNTGIGVKDCQALSELLSQSKSLKELHIGGNDLPPEAVELIISGLGLNATLEWLWMTNSQISLLETVLMASLLNTNRTLVHLNLAECNIVSDGAPQLANALCTNSTLEKLDMRGNAIGPIGAASFAKMLLENKSLKVLNLQDDSIGEEGTEQLIDSLTHNTTVEELWLPSNNKSCSARGGVGSRVRITDI